MHHWYKLGWEYFLKVRFNICLKNHLFHFASHFELKVIVFLEKNRKISWFDVSKINWFSLDFMPVKPDVIIQSCGNIFGHHQ